LTKFITVFIAGMVDSKGFLIMYVIMILYFSLIFHLLGCKFDDEETNQLHILLNDDGDDSYDGDYPLLAYGITSLFGNVRTAYGDVQMPDYGFWVETAGVE
jgi:hypothetical protein